MSEGNYLAGVLIIVAYTLIILSWKKQFLYDARLGNPLTYFVVLGFFAFIPVQIFLDETSKWIVFGILISILAFVHVKRIVAEHWQFWAEIEAEALVEQGKYDEAIHVLQVKRVREGATLLLLNDLAYCLDLVGEQEEALLVLDEAELRFGKHRELTVKRAVCLTKLGMIDEALAVMRAAVEASPHDFELAYQFTVMFLKLDRRDDAERQFDQAEILYLRTNSDEMRKEWQPKLERLRRQINDPSPD
jgi:hypothetical protein